VRSFQLQVVAATLNFLPVGLAIIRQEPERLFLCLSPHNVVLFGNSRIVMPPSFDDVTWKCTEAASAEHEARRSTLAGDAL
jgi:hypothetical protein